MVKVAQSAILATLAAGVVAYQQRRAAFPYNFSPLSPIVTYYNSPGNNADWTLNRTGAYSNTPNSYFQFDYYGCQVTLSGSGQNVSSQDPRTKDELSMYRFSPGYQILQKYVGVVNGTNQTTTGPLLAMLGTECAQRIFNITMRVEDAPGAFINLTSGHPIFIVPADEYYPRNNTIAPAVEANNATSARFSDEQGNGWSVSTPSYNNSAGYSVLPYDDRYGKSPYGPSLLSTTTRNAGLRIRVPSLTSAMLIHGPVTPDQGRYSVEIVNRTAMLDYPHQMLYEYNAARPVSALDELKVAANLDPRVEYDAIVRLTEDGKRADIQGAVFTSSISSTDDVTNWWDPPSYSTPNKLEGGAIAGIVVGSVVGAILIALCIWLFLRRRNKRNHAAAANEAAGHPGKSDDMATLNSRA